jgi:hypothetical protein
MSKQSELVGLARTTNLDEVNAAYSAGALSNRNLIINGAMQVAQRGVSFASWTGTAAYCLDRWKYTNYQSGAVTISQDIDAPSGFSNSLKISTTSTDAGTSTYSFLQQLIAGQDVASLAYGSAVPKQVTVSFWVKSNMTGVYTFNIATQTSGRRVASTYTVTSANTWEYKTITFDGDSASTIVYDSTLGLICEWWFAAGSNFTSSPLPTAWSATTNTSRSTGITVGINASTSNYVNITGVQLEVGPATSFEHRSYGQELALCQRYYWSETGSGDDLTTNYATLYNTSYSMCIVDFPVTMRVNPTVAAASFTSSILGNYHSRNRIQYYLNSASASVNNITADAEL